MNIVNDLPNGTVVSAPTLKIVSKEHESFCGLCLDQIKKMHSYVDLFIEEVRANHQGQDLGVEMKFAQFLSSSEVHITSIIQSAKECDEELCALKEAGFRSQT